MRSTTFHFSLGAAVTFLFSLAKRSLHLLHQSLIRHLLPLATNYTVSPFGMLTVDRDYLYTIFKIHYINQVCHGVGTATLVIIPHLRLHLFKVLLTDDLFYRQFFFQS